MILASLEDRSQLSQIKGLILGDEALVSGSVFKTGSATRYAHLGFLESRSGGLKTLSWLPSLLIVASLWLPCSSYLLGSQHYLRQERRGESASLFTPKSPVLSSCGHITALYGYAPRCDKVTAL